MAATLEATTQLDEIVDLSVGNDRDISVLAEERLPTVLQVNSA